MKMETQRQSKKVNRIKSHQYFIFRRIDSGIINTKNASTTTVTSAPKYFPAKLACTWFMNLEKVGSFTD